MSIALRPTDVAEVVTTTRRDSAPPRPRAGSPSCCRCPARTGRGAGVAAPGGGRSRPAGAAAGQPAGERHDVRPHHGHRGPGRGSARRDDASSRSTTTGPASPRAIWSGCSSASIGPTGARTAGWARGSGWRSWPSWRRPWVAPCAPSRRSTDDGGSRFVLTLRQWQAAAPRAVSRLTGYAGARSAVRGGAVRWAAARCDRAAGGGRGDDDEGAVGRGIGPGTDQRGDGERRHELGSPQVLSTPGCGRVAAVRASSGSPTAMKSHRAMSEESGHTLRAPASSWRRDTAGDAGRWSPARGARRARRRPAALAPWHSRAPTRLAPCSRYGKLPIRRDPEGGQHAP